MSKFLLDGPLGSAIERPDAVDPQLVLARTSLFVAGVIDPALRTMFGHGVIDQFLNPDGGNDGPLASDIEGSAQAEGITHTVTLLCPRAIARGGQELRGFLMWDVIDVRPEAVNNLGLSGPSRGGHGAQVGVNYSAAMNLPGQSIGAWFQQSGPYTRYGDEVVFLDRPSFLGPSQDPEGFIAAGDGRIGLLRPTIDHFYNGLIAAKLVPEP